MALTLVEAAKLHTGDVVRSAIIELYARESDVLRVMPFDNIDGNALKYNREATLSGIAFRGVNEAYPESTGVLNPQVEQLVITGGDLDVDMFIIKTMGADQRSVQEAMKIKSLSATWSNKFINGNSLTTPKEFDGLKVRLIGNQLISNGTTDGGDPLSLATLDAAIDAVDNPTHLLMPRAMRRRLSTAARSATVGGYVTYGPDEFGRRITSYNDLPILIGDNSDDYSPSLGFNEVGSTGSTATATSIYILSLREGMLQGIQNGVMDVRDLGEQDAKPVMRTRVEWYTSIALLHPRAAARLYGISNAAVLV